MVDENSSKVELLLLSIVVYKDAAEAQCSGDIAARHQNSPRTIECLLGKSQRAKASGINIVRNPSQRDVICDRL